MKIKMMYAEGRTGRDLLLGATTQRRGRQQPARAALPCWVRGASGPERQRRQRPRPPRSAAEMETVQHAGSWEWEGVSRHNLDGALVHGELGNHGPRRRSTAEVTKAIRATQWEKMAQI
jgi:hypothetical protein